MYAEENIYKSEVQTFMLPLSLSLSLVKLQLFVYLGYSDVQTETVIKRLITKLVLRTSIRFRYYNFCDAAVDRNNLDIILHSVAMSNNSVYIYFSGEKTGLH